MVNFWVGFFFLWNVTLTAFEASDLDQFQKTGTYIYSQVSSTSFSGITLFKETGNLLVVDNADQTLYEISPAGEILGERSLVGFQDCEGLSYYAEGKFYMVEEGRGRVHLVSLPVGGADINYPDTYYTVEPDLGNSGLEGVAYSPSNQKLYIVRETGPTTLYQLELDAEGIPISHSGETPFGLNGKYTGDAAGIYVTEAGEFLIVNQEGNQLLGFSATGELLGQIDLDMEKPEGVTVDEATQTIYVTGEAHELVILTTEALARKPRDLSPFSEIPGLRISAHPPLILFATPGGLPFTLLGRRQDWGPGVPHPVAP